MAEEEKVTTVVEFKGVEGSIAELKFLKKQLKEIPLGTEDWDKMYNKIDDLEDKLKSSKKSSSDWIDTLEGAGGPLGMLGAGLNKAKVATQSFGGALKATGIGLIVSLIGGLVAAFSQTEGSMKKLEPLLIAMEQIFGGIMEAMQPVIDGFIELAIKIMPYVTVAFKKVYSAVTAVFQSLGKIGSAIVKLFKGDFSGAWEDAKSSVTGFMDNFEAAEERFEAGTKKMTKTQKKNLKEQSDANDKYLADTLKMLDAEQKAREAALDKAKALALSGAKTEQEKLDIEKEFAKKAYDAQVKLFEDKKKAMEKYGKKGTAEYKELLAERDKLDAENIKNATSFAEQQKKIDEDNLKAKEEFAKKESAIRLAAIKDEQEKAKQAREDKYQEDLAALEKDKEFIKKSEEEKAKLRADLLKAKQFDLDKIKKDAEKKAMEEDLALLQAQQKTLTEGTKAYLDNSIAIENAAYAIKKANAKDNAKAIEAINTEHEQNLKDIKLKAAIAEKQITLERLAVISSIGNSLSQLAGKNKAIAIAGIAIEKAAAIGSIITNTQIANLKAVAASPLTFGQPWVTVNTIAGALSVAAAVAAGIKAVQELNAVDTPKDAPASKEVAAPTGRKFAQGGLLSGPSHGQGGIRTPYGEMEGGEFVINKRSTNSFLPLLKAINNTGNKSEGGTTTTMNDIKEMIGSQQQPIIKTYVVSSELKTQQEADQRLSQLARI